MNARTVKHVITVSIAATVLLAAVIAFAFAVWFVTRRGSSDRAATTTTPDGRQWTLVTQLNTDGTRIAVIEDSSGVLAFTGSMRCSEHSRWFVHGSTGEFWIYSGDIGILHYARDSGGQWSEQFWIESRAAAKMPREFYSKLPDTSRRRIDPANVLP